MQRSIFSRLNPEKEKPFEFSQEKADEALEAFKELHGRSIFLAGQRYEQCNVIDRQKPDGAVSYLHHKNIPFKKEPVFDYDGIPYPEMLSEYLAQSKSGLAAK